MVGADTSVASREFPCWDDDAVVVVGTARPRRLGCDIQGQLLRRCWLQRVIRQIRSVWTRLLPVSEPDEAEDEP